MEQQINAGHNDPVSTSERDRNRESMVPQPANELQFEEAVQRLREALEKPPRQEVFY